MTVSIGFDIGGTFTDLMLFDSSSDRWHVAKVRTTPRDLATGCMDGLRLVLRTSDSEPQTVRYVAHGSTVATNTLIERRGAKTALVTTRGFRDVLEIRRQVMPHRYDATVPKPEPLVARPLRVEVGERTLADGRVESELDSEELTRVLAELANAGVEAVAICFLHSYANPANERLAEAVAREARDWFVTSSHQVLNELREYERTSTTVANAYLAPGMRNYLEVLAAELEHTDISAPLLVFQSNGGLAPATSAADLPITCLLSGPAAGVVAACAIAGQCGVSDFISLDIGGTSCDVALVNDRQPREALEQEVAGWPIRTPRLDIHSIGAGGGSVAWIDGGGLLRVGPRSAGAQPGPAAYGLGGKEPTVTDAHVVLGRIGSHQELAANLVISGELATASISRLGARLGLSPVETAVGILDVVNASMIQAIRLISVEHGHDPRAYSLIAFGGAGPMHACDLARAMGLRTVLVPPRPGVLCALGLLLADMRVDASATRHFELNADSSARLQDALTALEAELRRSVAVTSRPDLEWEASYAVDTRYVGQGFHLSVPVSSADAASLNNDRLAAAFDDAHRATYGYAWERSSKEVVGVRASMRARVGMGTARLPALPATAEVTSSSRPVHFKETGWVHACPVLTRELCSPGFELVGPAVIEQMDSTVVVPPDFQLRVDEGWNLVLSRFQPHSVGVG